ncbi:MAG: peptidylprolyl isomerase [Patescibacteria group bacterium]|nr:peptidylprolyl isomerase [Patescibacteria group bacterium]
MENFTEGENRENPVISPAPQETNENEKQKRNLKMFLIGIAGVILLSVIVCVGIGIYRVYAKGATDGFSAAIATTLRLPVLKVNGVSVLYKDYLDDLKAIHVMREYAKTVDGQGAEWNEEELSDQVLWRLANNIFTAQAAKTFDVKIEDADLKEVRDQLITQLKDEAAVNAEITKRYGWNLSVYEEKVIKPYILQSKLAEKIQLDQNMMEEARARAQKVLDEIKAGADFAEMAKKYGQDGTAQNGGDLGWFAKGDMVSQFEEVAFALKKGEMSQELVETSFGWHIIKVEDKKTEAKVEKIQGRHILFLFPSLDKYMDDLAHKAEIHLYISVHNPFEELKTK